MTNADQLPPELSDARSSTRHVYEVLRDRGEWTSDQYLRERTGYGRHTVSRACRDLQGADLATRRNNPNRPQVKETRLRCGD